MVVVVVVVVVVPGRRRFLSLAERLDCRWVLQKGRGRHGHCVQEDKESTYSQNRIKERYFYLLLGATRNYEMK